MAEKLTTKEVVRLLNIVKYNLVSSLEDRIEELKKMLISLESELEEQKNVLFHYNEKIGSAKSILEVWKKACKEVKEEFLRVYDEKQILQKLVYEFKHNDKIYLEIQNIADDKVKGFLADKDGIKLLEFALMAVAEALRQDPQMDLLIEKTPSVQNYDFDSKEFLPNPWDFDYPHIAKEKVLELSTEHYSRLIKGHKSDILQTLQSQVNKVSKKLDSSSNLASINMTSVLNFVLSKLVLPLKLAPEKTTTLANTAASRINWR